MAANETAALVVALSAQVSKFQKDMDSANGIANKAVKQIEDRFAAAGGVISNKLSSSVQGAAAQLGTVGLALTALGPIGLTVAAGIGALALAFSFVSDKTEAFVEKAKRLKEVSEEVGLTATQLRILFEAGKQVGVESENTEKFLQRLAIALEHLKTAGGGPLFDALIRISPELVRQVSSAKDLASAIDILSKAYHSLTDEGKKLDLIRTISGQRNLTPGRLLDDIADKGGFKALEDGAEAAGKAIDKAVIDKIVTLKREIEDLKRKTDNVYGRMFAVETLEAQKRSGEIWLQLAQNIERFAKASRESVDAANSGQRQATQFGRRFRGVDRPFSPDEPGGPAGPTTNDVLGQKLIELGRARLGIETEVKTAIEARTAAETKATEAETKVPLATQLELMKKWTSVLGDAITPTEALKLKILELSVAQEKGGVSDTVRARALNAFKLAQSGAALSARESLGIANEQEIVTQKLAELEDKRAKGFVKNAQEMATAEQIVARESKASAEALQVRASKTPELTRALLDARNASKQFDQVATSSFNNAADAFSDIVTQTKSFKDAMHDLINSLAKDLSRVAFKSLIGSAFGGSGGNVFSGLFGGSPGGGGSGPIGNNAGGTDNWRGGPTWVGENGPEIVNLPQGSQVIPNNVARNSGGGVNVTIAPMIDARGADSIQVARIEATVAKLTRDIPGMVLTSVNDARRRSVKI